MASPGTLSGIIRFGPFELDPAKRELRKRGSVVKLQPQQFAVLLLLVERAGNVVCREDPPGMARLLSYRGLRTTKWSAWLMNTYRKRSVVNSPSNSVV